MFSPCVLALEERKKKAAEVKRMEEERRRQRDKERALKEQAAQREYARYTHISPSELHYVFLQFILHRRMEEESRKTREAEELISNLEKEELILIERLKSAQSLQQKAYSALQTSLDL